MFLYYSYISANGNKWNEGSELERQQNAFFKTAGEFLKDVSRIDSIKQRMLHVTKICIKKLSIQQPSDPCDLKIAIQDYWSPLNSVICL